MSKHIPTGSKYLEKPIIQGGMGVGASLGNLAGAIMKEGGMGMTSVTHPRYRKKNFWKNPLACNIEAVYEEAAKARTISGDRGFLGANMMVASHHYEDYVKAAIGVGVDIIISGAGMPMNLPSVEGSDRVVLAPIISSSRTACPILKGWDRYYRRYPDFTAVEGSLAGGHLGSKKEELLSDRVKKLSELVCGVLQEIQVYEELYQTSIPVSAAGGVYTREDIATLLNIGVSGIQTAIRFITTAEYDADLALKQKVVNIGKEDTTLIANPTGLPGRAVMTAFMRDTLKGRIAPKHCIGCMKPYVPVSTPYYVSDALAHSIEGDMEDGLVFAGANV